MDTGFISTPLPLITKNKKMNLSSTPAMSRQTFPAAFCPRT